MKVFIAGSRAESNLDIEVINRLQNIYSNNYTVFVGDADGVDSSVQKFFFDKNYKDVFIFASNGKARNNYGNWEIKNVQVPDDVKGFDFYVAKDEAMAQQTDYGFMIWDGESRGTFNNIINLINLNKTVLVYYNKMFHTIKNNEDLQNFVKQNVKLNMKLIDLISKKLNPYVQMSM